MFPEEGSGASDATASKLPDAVALLPNCSGEQSDAPSAHTQSDLSKGMSDEAVVDTWIELLEPQRPTKGKCLHTETGQRPVCELLKSLCGHPMSGLYREKHYNCALTNRCDFQKMG